MKQLTRKAQKSFSINDIGSIAIALVVAAVVLGLGATILERIQSTSVGNSSAYNASDHGMQGMLVLAEFIPTIAIVAVAAIVIGIILVFFGRGR